MRWGLLKTVVLSSAVFALVGHYTWGFAHSFRLCLSLFGRDSPMQPPAQNCFNLNIFPDCFRPIERLNAAAKTRRGQGRSSRVRQALDWAERKWPGQAKVCVRVYAVFFVCVHVAHCTFHRRTRRTCLFSYAICSMQEAKEDSQEQQLRGASSLLFTRVLVWGAFLLSTWVGRDGRVLFLAGSFLLVWGSMAAPIRRRTD